MTVNFLCFSVLDVMKIRNWLMPTEEKGWDTKYGIIRVNIYSGM